LSFVGGWGRRLPRVGLVARPASVLSR
jgi:hypothetical protein